MNEQEIAGPSPVKIGRADVEPSVSSVQRARQALATAQRELAEAEEATDGARRKCADDKERYLSDPTDAHDAAVEASEQDVRRTERYSEAMRRRVEAAKRELLDAERLAAAGEANHARRAIARIDREVAGHLHELASSVHVAASKHVARIESLLVQKQILCEHENAAARVAGIAATAHPTEPETARIACGILIAGGQPRQDEAIGEVETRNVDAVLSQLENGRLTAAERGIVLRSAADELVRVTTATTSDWLRPQFPPPEFLAHLPTATLFREAQNLLCELKKEI